MSARAYQIFRESESGMGRSVLTMEGVVRPLLATWLGRIAYRPAVTFQRAQAGRRASGAIPDVLLLLEHDDVYTIGRSGSRAEVLFDERTLVERKIAVEETDRGGRVTYHGPGQLVGYPIIDLGQTGDSVGYLRALERALVEVAADFGVCAWTIPGLTGVWVGNDKIAAIGVHIERGITTHGFALNVTTDLSAFNGIVPCGILGRGVTSLAAVTGRSVSLAEVVWSAARHVAQELHRALALVEPRVVDARNKRRKRPFPPMSWVFATETPEPE